MLLGGDGGEVRLGKRFVAGDPDGDGRADFRIGFGRPIDLDEDNFLL